jgi:hypothetical protein
MRLLAITLLAALVLPAAAGARSVYDPDIGWPAARLAALHLPRVRQAPCTRDLTKAQIHLQSIVAKRGNPREGLRKIFNYRWGNAWYDPCDGGRLGVGLQPGITAAQLKAARALIARRHLTAQVRFFAVRSTYRELSDVLDDVDVAFAPLLDQALIEYGIQTDRNTIVIDVARPVAPADRARLRAYALAAPVNVVVHDGAAADFKIVDD